MANLMKLKQIRRILKDSVEFDAKLAKSGEEKIYETISTWQAKQTKAKDVFTCINVFFCDSLQSYNYYPCAKVGNNIYFLFTQ